MLRTLTPLFLFGLATLASTAQQNIWGHNPLRSPEVHPDGRVTFRLLAPKAQQVQLTGDFLPAEERTTAFGKMWVDGRRSLQRDTAGVWSFTTEQALAPELYQYAFHIDSLQVPDPSNVYRHRDTNLTTDVFLVGGGVEGQYAVNDVPHGSIVKQWYASPSLRATRRLSIYLPPHYFEQSHRRFPVLYLLHGMGGDEEAWLAMGRAAQIFDNLIATGRMTPAIVVLPNGNVSQQAAPGEGSNGFVPPQSMLPRTMNGEYEAAFPDIVRFVDRHFRTLPKAKHRAIAGLSMGGFHSLHTAINHPTLFHYVGLFSAAIQPREDNVSPIYADVPTKLSRLYAHRPSLFYIAIGRDDFLFKDNVRFRQQLDQLQLPYTYRETDGGHTWRNWRRYLLDFLPRLFRP